MTQARPLVLIAQPLKSSSDGFAAVIAALAADGKEARVVKNKKDLSEALRDPRCVCAFLGDGFVPDAPALVHAVRQISPVEWYFVQMQSDRKLSYRLIEAGVRAILTHPLAPFQYVQRVRQVLVAQPKPYGQRRGPSEWGASEPAVTVSVPPVSISPVSATPESAAPSLEWIDASTDFRSRRPEWGRLSQTMITRTFASGDDLRRQCESDLLQLAQAEPRSVIGLLSLRPDDPLDELPPRKVRFIVSCDPRERGEVVDASGFPEALRAIELDRAVVLGTHAAIPLRNGGKITGIMRVQLAQSLTPKSREFLADLVSFSGYFVPAFTRLDFLRRVYRQLELR